jgi:hypothetical protein
MVNVLWASTTVETKKPQTSICIPEVPSDGAVVSRMTPSPKQAVPRRMGIRTSKRSSTSGKLHEVGDEPHAGSVVRAVEDPTHVGVQKSSPGRGVDVLVFIGVLVMVPMMGGPPQRPFLRARVADESEQELKPSRSLVASMGKIPVVEAGDRKHPRPVKCEADEKRHRAEAHPEDQKRHEVNGDEGDGRDPGNAAVGGDGRVAGRISAQRKLSCSGDKPKAWASHAG